MAAHRYPVVLFDLDGTLIDSIPLILESMRHALRAHGLPVPGDDVILAGVGRRLEAQMERFARSRDEALALAATYREHNLAVHDDWVRVFPGVPEVVRALDGDGVRLGVVTSKRSDGARRGLEVTGLARHFPVLVAADHVDGGKPHPEPIHRALAAMGWGRDAAPPAAVYVGDTTHDLEAAHAAGIDAIAVTWGVGDPKALAAARPHQAASPSLPSLRGTGGPRPMGLGRVRGGGRWRRGRPRIATPRRASSNARRRGWRGGSPSRGG